VTATNSDFPNLYERSLPQYKTAIIFVWPLKAVKKLNFYESKIKPKTAWTYYLLKTYTKNKANFQQLYGSTCTKDEKKVVLVGFLEGSGRGKSGIKL